jgi:hypothetical protein
MKALWLFTMQEFWRKYNTETWSAIIPYFHATISCIAVKEFLLLSCWTSRSTFVFLSPRPAEVDLDEEAHEQDMQTALSTITKLRQSSIPRDIAMVYK